MDEQTIDPLNQINRAFYRVTAGHFDESRQRAWPGWERLAVHLRTPLTVLDVGCGNGRFGRFLAQHFDRSAVRYHGLDSTPELLERAREALIAIDAVLEERDVIEQPPDSGQFDLVVAFGVLHHVPGHQQRQDFVRLLAQRVGPGGVLAFACWRFYEYERFRQRIVPWPEGFAVEPNDFLLDWRRGENALRYCHYINNAEHAALVAATGLTEIDDYRADGESGDLNRYSVLRRTAVSPSPVGERAGG